MKTSHKVAKEPVDQAPPALTTAGREARLIGYAVDLAEKQLRDGSASSQVITHFLKLATERERLERERLENENALLRAKADAISSAKESGELYAQAIEAMRRYSAHSSDND